MKRLLQEASELQLQLSLATWASVLSSFAVEGLGTVETLHELFKASKPSLEDREEIHQAMNLASCAGDLERLAAKKAFHTAFAMI